MSGSDWIKRPSARLAGGLIVAILAGSVILAYGHSESAEYERQADAKSGEYARYTSKKVTQTCLGLVAVERARCFYDAANAQAEYEYNQSDLVAQRQSALWGYIMAFAAVIGMVLSAVGVWLVWTTFRATKEANEISQDHQRARILVSADFRVLPYTEGKARVTLYGENAGYSTAYHCQSFVTVADNVPNEFPKELTSGDTSAIKAADKADFTVIDLPIRNAHVLGRIEYHTIFGGPKFSYFCFEFEFSDLTRNWYAVNRLPKGWPKDT
ncbi:MAG: hypothetical protein ACKOUT_11245 [Novosphingobium sp.]